MLHLFVIKILLLIFSRYRSMGSQSTFPMEFLKPILYGPDSALSDRLVSDDNFYSPVYSFFPKIYNFIWYFF